MQANQPPGNAMKYHHGNLKQQLILCTYDWIAVNGFDRLSLRQIAKIANVSQTAPYRHFDSKEHLLAEVGALAFDNFSREMNENGVTNDPAEDLVKCGVTYVEFGLKHPYIIELMFNHPLKGSDFPNFFAAADRAFGELQTRIKRLHRGNNDATRLNSVSTHAYVHGLLSIIQINQRIGDAGTTDYYKASSQVKINLEKMLAAFVKNLDFS